MILAGGWILLPSGIVQLLPISLDHGEHLAVFQSLGLLIWTWAVWSQTRTVSAAYRSSRRRTATSPGLRARRATWIILSGILISIAHVGAAEPVLATNAVASPDAVETNLPAPALVLQNVREISHLSLAQAKQRLPVKLCGVITYADPGWKHFFVQDTTGGIYVRSWQNGLKAGQRVEVSAWTVPAGKVHMLTDASVRLLGLTNLPTPLRVTVPEMQNRDCQWVELEGVIRAINPAPVRLSLKLSTREGDLDAVITATNYWERLRPLINAKVRMQGVSAVALNSRQEVVGTQLRAPNLACVVILEKAPANAFDVAACPIGQVSTNSPAQLGLHRVRVCGVVSLVIPGGEFFLQDASGAVRVHTAQPDAYPAGKALEVVGFPVTDGAATRLDEAIFRYDKPALDLVPGVTTASALLAAATPEHRLVSLEGQLLNEAGDSTLPILLIQDGAVVFQARFASPDPQTPAPHWSAGSRLRLTGVADRQVETPSQPRSFVLLLRSPADVQLLSLPPWWTPREALALAGGLAVAIVVIVVWVALLRRTVRQQTSQIRQRLETEAGLEKQLMLVWETSAEGMCMTNDCGDIVRVNEAYCRMVGKLRNELEGQPLTVVQAAAPGEASLAEYCARFARREVPRTEEIQLTLGEGGQTWLEVTNSFFEHPPFPVLLLSQYRDITGRKRAQAEQERLEAVNQQLHKSDSLGRMAGAIAHNFNNQLQSVIIGLEMGLEDRPPNKAPDANLDAALRSARKAAEISAQMLLYLGQTHVKLQPLDLAATVREGLPMLLAAMPKNVTLSSVLPASGPNILANANQIQQVLANLLTNAWEACGDHSGTIQLTITQVTASNIPAANRFPVDWQPQGVNHACLEVEDSGIGITAGDLDKLFDPFFSTKFAGRGLGLSVVLGIIKNYGGSITVASQPDHGCIFKIFLPVTTAAVFHQPIPAPAPKNVHGDTVLVVDDDASLRKFAEIALQRSGYKVISAVDGVEALELFRQHRNEIGCVLCDLTMPRLGGWETLTELRRLDPGVLVVITSGYNEAKVMEGQHPEMPQAFLRKPCDIKELLKTIQQVLQAPREPKITPGKTPSTEPKH